MAEADLEKTLSVPKDKLFNAIVKYEDYPDFVDTVNGVEVISREGDPENPKTRIRYTLSIMTKTFSYTLDHFENRGGEGEAAKIRWELVESDFFDKNVGSWTLTPSGDQTRARYEIELEFKIKVPGFILKKLVKGNLPKLMESFESRARSQ